MKTLTKAVAEQPSASSSSAAPLPVPVCHLNMQQSTSESQTHESSTTTTLTVSETPTSNLVTPSGNLVAVATPESSEPTTLPCACAICKYRGPPSPELPGFTLVLNWISVVNPTKPLKSIISDKIKGPLEKKPTNIKGRKVGAQIKVLIDGKYGGNLQKMAQEDEKRKKKKN